MKDEGAGQESLVANKIDTLIGPTLKLVLLASVLTSIYVTCLPAATTVLAGFHLLIDLDKPSLINSQGSDLHRKRLIQKHFLKYGIYIPIDDVVFTHGEHDETLYNQLLEKSCGEARLYIWVPLKFRLPLVGEKVSEWCLAMK